jgi:hypothetical protein
MRIEVIPNGLDVDRYKPIDSRIARELLSLPQDKALILFGGKGAADVRNKGFHLLEQALQRSLAADGATLLKWSSLAPRASSAS